MKEQLRKTEDERITALEKQLTQVEADLSSIKKALVSTQPIAGPSTTSFDILEHVMWTHGNSLYLPTAESFKQFESISRGDRGTTLVFEQEIEPFVHFAIPTPAVVSERNLRLRSVIVRFSCSSNFIGINQIFINDGQKQLFRQEGIYISGSELSQMFNVPGSPLVSSGIGVDVRIRVIPDFPEDVNITFHAIGGEFVFQRGLEL